jgi:hypothetical protein
MAASIMTTMAGVVAVDRAVFGAPPSEPPDVNRLGESPADLHLRGLCASCHLGAVKARPGPVDEGSRGGGCLACHVVYDAAARADLGRPPAAGAPFAHPQLVATPSDLHCFGCHSRSGRLSLAAAGFREAAPGETVARTLPDGRGLARTTGDAHVEAGMTCVDCHTSWEVMGDGRAVRHREDQQQVTCEDCHASRGMARAVASEALDAETRRLATRAAAVSPGDLFVAYGSQGRAFPHVRLATDGQVLLRGKADGRTRVAPPPGGACARDGLHGRLACATCHDAWVPQCIDCHTAWDPDSSHIDLLDDREKPGEWVETPGRVRYDRPVLGARLRPDGSVRRYEGFAPGMILTITERPGVAPRFARRYAPVSGHTTRRAARTCDECHRSSLALGFGRGTLAAAGGRWRFAPELPPHPADGLPRDAWIAPGAVRGPEATTRRDTRPLSPEEQRRLLRVGACLECHPPDGPVMGRARSGVEFAALVAAKTAKCRVPSGF